MRLPHPHPPHALVRAALDRLPAETRMHAHAAATEAIAAARSLADAAGDAREGLLDRLGLLLAPRPPR